MDNTIQLQELINAINKLTTQLEQNNNKHIKSSRNHDIYYYIKRYIQEVMEASFGLLSVTLITSKKFVFYDFIKIVLIIGLITLLLEEYNMSAAENFKQGIQFTMGSTFLSTV